MEIHFLESFEKEYRKITKGNPRLQAQVQKQLWLVRKNLKHPSLRLHKLKSTDYWSISIDSSIRVLVVLKKEDIYVTHIGKHEDVY